MSSYALCVIGNSHSATLWQAWKARTAPAADGFAITVFASQATSLDDLVLKHGTFTCQDADVRASFARTSGGLDRIKIARYDAFLIAGMGFNVDATRMFKRARVVEYVSRDSERSLVSHACMVEMIRCHAEASPAVRLADSIRTVSRAPILIYPTPYPPESLLERDQYRGDAILRDRELMARIIPRGMKAVEDVAGRRGCEIVWQDATTIAYPGFTQAKFAYDALNLKHTINKPDGRHVNLEFGQLCLPAILARLDEISGGRVLATEAAKPARRRKVAA